MSTRVVSESTSSFLQGFSSTDLQIFDNNLWKSLLSALLPGSTQSSLNPLNQLRMRTKEILANSNSINMLPVIPTGSAVEGCSMARLSHPSAENIIYLEIDVMLLLGQINKSVAENSFKNIPGKKGFFLVELSEDVEKSIYYSEFFFPREKRGIFFEERRCLNGRALKESFHSTQPKRGKAYQRVANVADGVTTINVDTGLEGPSAAISFDIEVVNSQEQQNGYLELLQNTVKKIEEMEHDCETKLEKMKEIEKELQEMVCQLETEHQNLVSSCGLNEANKIEIPEEVNGKALLWCQLFRERIKLINEVSNVFRAYEMPELHGAVGLRYYPMFIFADSHICMLEKKIKRKDFVEWLPVVKSLINSNDEQNNEDVTGVLENVFKVFLSDFSTNLIRTGKSYMQGIVENIRKHSAINLENLENSTIKVDIDNVPCFECPFWPNEAAEFIDRNRKWPPREDIEAIAARGCHIVSKCSADGNDNIEWRWSFSRTELLLSNLRSKEQKYVYYIFKCIFYKFLKFQFDERCLPSYLAKTLMLWECEKHDFDWWNKEPIDDIILLLLKELREMFSSGFLPHYFLTDCNLIGEYSKDHLEKAAKVVDDLVKNIHQCAISELTVRKMKFLQDAVMQERLACLNDEFDTKETEIDQAFTEANVAKLEKHLKGLKKYITTIYLKTQNQFVAQYAVLLTQLRLKRYMYNMLSADLSPELQIMMETTKTELAEMEERLVENYLPLVEIVPEMLKTCKMSCTSCNVCGAAVLCSDERMSCQTCWNTGGYHRCVNCEDGDHEHEMTRLGRCYPSCPVQYHRVLDLLNPDCSDELIQESLSKSVAYLTNTPAEFFQASQEAGLGHFDLNESNPASAMENIGGAEEMRQLFNLGQSSDDGKSPENEKEESELHTAELIMSIEHCVKQQVEILKCKLKEMKNVEEKLQVVRKL